MTNDREKLVEYFYAVSKIPIPDVEGEAKELLEAFFDQHSSLVNDFCAKADELDEGFDPSEFAAMRSLYNAEVAYGIHVPAREEI
jgi:hypothetical protein